MSGEPTGRCPMTTRAVTDAYFMEHRAKILDVAAFLDRLDRAADAPQADDFRTAALREAVGLLIDGNPDRVQRVLELFSDPSAEPIAAAPMKGATGAHDPSGGGA